MRSGSVATIALLALVASTHASAHQRDEYLQAIRVALQPDAADIELDLTPGMAVADAFLAIVDANRDGALSPGERQHYAEQIVRALVVAFDTHPVAAQLSTATFPDVEAVKRGEGAIHVRARATLPGAAAGPHRLLVKSLHLPGQSVYLANALAPESARIGIVAQRRLPDQSELTIEYTVAADPRLTRAGLTASVVVAALLLVPATRRLRRA